MLGGDHCDYSPWVPEKPSYASGGIVQLFLSLAGVGGGWSGLCPGRVTPANKVSGTC
jgi:hypothetical protein